MCYSPEGRGGEGGRRGVQTTAPAVYGEGEDPRRGEGGRDQTKSLFSVSRPVRPPSLPPPTGPPDLDLPVDVSLDLDPPRLLPWSEVGERKPWDGSDLETRRLCVVDVSIHCCPPPLQTPLSGARGPFLSNYLGSRKKTFYYDPVLRPYHPLYLTPLPSCRGFRVIDRSQTRFILRSVPQEF